MRTQGQIKQQLKQVTYRHLQRLLRVNFKQKPSACCHNKPVVVDDDPQDHTVYACGFINPGGDVRNVICDSRVTGCDTMAKGCHLWSPLKTKAQVKEDFNAILMSKDRGIIAASYPDIAALMWVLDLEEPDLPVEIGED